MLQLILDTDLGVEADDAAAMALAGALHAMGACRLCAVITSSARRGSVAAVRAVLRYHNLTIPVGKLKAPFLDCDQENVYLTELNDMYREADTAEENLKMLQQIVKREGPFVWVTTGPLTNVADFITASPDLMRDKIARVVVMGGRKGNKPDETAVRNFDAAQTVFAKCPVPIDLVPYELGNKIKTGGKLVKGPIGMAIRTCAEKSGKPLKEKKPILCTGWAPAAVLAAVRPDLFRFTEGTVSLQDTGALLFRAAAGGAVRFASASPSRLQTELEKIYPKLP